MNRVVTKKKPSIKCISCFSITTDFYGSLCRDCYEKGQSREIRERTLSDLCASIGLERRRRVPIDLKDIRHCSRRPYADDLRFWKRMVIKALRDHMGDCDYMDGDDEEDDYMDGVDEEEDDV